MKDILLNLNGAFKNGLHKLNTLENRGNKLNSFGKELQKISHYLDLVDNQMTSMNDRAFEGLVNLTNLILYGNKIPSGAIREL